MLNYRLFHLSWISIVLLGGLQISQRMMSSASTDSTVRPQFAVGEVSTQLMTDDIAVESFEIPNQGRPVGRLRGGSSR